MAFELKKNKANEEDVPKKKKLTEKSTFAKIITFLIFIIVFIVGIILLFAFDTISHAILGKKELDDSNVLSQIPADEFKYTTVKEILARTDPHPIPNEFGGIDLFVYEITTDCVIVYHKDSQDLNIALIYKVELLRVMIRKELCKLHFDDFKTKDSQKKIANKIRDVLNKFFTDDISKYFPGEEKVKNQILDIFLNNFSYKREIL